MRRIKSYFYGRVIMSVFVLLMLAVFLGGCGRTGAVTEQVEAVLIEEEPENIAEPENVGEPENVAEPENAANPGNVEWNWPEQNETEQNETYVVVNNNQPYFNADDYKDKVFEEYSELDELGRCGAAFANICKELMPTEERGEIGKIRPSGWHTVKYPGIIEDNYLYNRCHLIGYQLAGENDNERNLITGTRYLNVNGMLGFENLIYDYVVQTNGHVLYRVTPVFEGDNLVASGVLMEAYSVEDEGAGVCFNVYVYNVQPGIVIDYATGESYAEENYAGAGDGSSTDNNAGSDNNQEADTLGGSDIEVTYILNVNSKKIHYPDCKSVDDMKEKNKIYFTGTRDEAIEEGYTPCGNCKP